MRQKFLREFGRNPRNPRIKIPRDRDQDAKVNTRVSDWLCPIISVGKDVKPRDF